VTTAEISAYLRDLRKAVDELRIEFMSVLDSLEVVRASLDKLIWALKEAAINPPDETAG
jgi:hypothetical protein